jgi:hypothetical protein
MPPVGEGGRNGAGLVGVLAVGAVCAACCFPPALAIAGAVVGLGAATAGWMVGSPVVLGVGLVCLVVLAFALRRWQPHRKRISEPMRSLESNAGANGGVKDRIELQMLPDRATNASKRH